MSRRAAYALLASVTIGPAAVAGADTEVVGVEERAPFVSAHLGVAVWSGYDRDRGGFVLRMRSGGVTSDLSVAPRPVAFDADVGVDAEGNLVVLYSRCAAEAALGFSDIRPRWASRPACRLYEYDVGDRRERALAGTHAAGASEALPSRAGRRLVFVRTRRHRGRTVRRLHVRDGRTRRVVALRGEPTSVDASSAAVAYLLERAIAPERCRTGGDDRLGPDEQSVWLLRRRPRRVARSCTGGPAVSSPTLIGDVLYLLARGADSTVRRVTNAGARTSSAPLPAGAYDVAVDGDTAVGVRFVAGSYEIFADGPLRFGRTRAGRTS